MTPDASGAWRDVEALFHEALAKAPEERLPWVAQACPDARVREEVSALLLAHDQHGILDQLIEEVMTPLRPPVATARATGLETTMTLPTHSRYRIIERIGGGGMGVVYRARDERLARDVALKFLPPHLSADRSAKKRFLVEARAAAAIEHPNICTVHEIGDSDDGQLYIVMTCYDGETLDRAIARGPLAIDRALHIASEIARGLAKAHERGIVHRDIKPANVMVTADGLVKILDFGIAKLADVNATHTEGAIGTLAYMSPEQAFGETVDHRSDVWSLGVVLYEMITGVRPFRENGDRGVLMAVLSAEPAEVTALRREVLPDVAAVIRKALNKRAAERFANALEMLAALVACAQPVTDRSSGPLRNEASRTPALSSENDSQESALTRAGERRQVTVVACTVHGQGTLVERLSPDDADQIIARVRDAAAEEAARFGGVLNHFNADEFVLLFGVTATHEKDAVHAVRAALALHARIARIAQSLDARWADSVHLRSGVHVGAMVAQRLTHGDRRFRITGSASDVAARLAAAADADTILLSPEAKRVVAPFVHTEASRPLTLSIAGESIVPFRALGASDVRSRLEGAAPEDLTPFVGRVRERDALASQLTSARAGDGRMTVLMGEAGAGKSRLLYEVRDLAAADDMRVIVGRCDAYGGTTPFLPFIDAAHDALGLPMGGTPHERHAAAVAAAREIDASLEEYLPLYLALLSIPSEAHPVPRHLQGELFQSAMLEAIAALFTVCARSAPTVLLLEDWHWADEASRAALRQLAEIVPAFAMLLVVTSRPDGSAEWGSADHQSVLHLAPLDSHATAAIARAILGAERVDPGLVSRLHERTGGNPFFLEEVCQALYEEGTVVVRDGQAAVVDASGSVHVPETVQGVLRTRIDRLGTDARDLLRIASVIGRDFTRGVLEDIAPTELNLAPALERLKASGLVQHVAVVPEAAFRFKHALAQEVAYDSLLEHQRGTLHAAVGHAMERRYAARLDEHAERLAHHFSRAESWGEAVPYGLQSADRAAALSQNVDALATLERVESWLLRLPDDHARRTLHADVLLRQERLCEPLGLRNRQLALVESLISALAPHGPSEQLAQVYLRQGDAFTLLRRFEAAERSLETALNICGERGDATGERSALRSIALLRSYEGRHEEALVIIERVLAMGRAAGDARAEAGDLATQANILRAMGRAEEALTVLLTALERTAAADNSVRYGALLNVIGCVYRDLGDVDSALAYFRRVVKHGLEERHPINVTFTLPAIAHLQLQQGHVEEALATYQEAVELNRKSRFAMGSAQVCRSLGEALVGLGRHEEAIPYVRDAIALFAQLEDVANEALMWRRLAVVYERMQAPNEARSAWERVQVLAMNGGDRAQEAEALAGMARAERELAPFEQMVVPHYEEALQLAVRAGDRSRELAVRNALGIVHWQRGDFADAVRHYEAALRVCRESADRVHEGLILNSLGATLSRLRRWDEARTVLGDAMRVSEHTGERQLQAHALAMLGDVYLATNRTGEALASFTASLRIRLSLDDRTGEGWMRERLARVQRALGDHDALRAEALAGLTIADELQDEALKTALRQLQEPITLNGEPSAALHH